MAGSTTSSRNVHGSRTVLFALWWAVTGSLLGLGVVSILTVGVALIVVGGVMALVGAKFFSADSTPVFALVGLAAVPLWMAYLYRHGPGRWCETDGSETSCSDLPWGPWGFLIVAALLLVAVPPIWRYQRRPRVTAQPTLS